MVGGIVGDIYDAESLIKNVKYNGDMPNDVGGIDGVLNLQLRVLKLIRQLLGMIK